MVTLYACTSILIITGFILPESVTGYTNTTSTKNTSSTILLKATDEVPVVSDRHRRGIGAAIVSGALKAARGASLGINFGLAVSKGCSFYPAICYDKEAIKNMDGEIKKLKRQYNEEFKVLNDQWVKLSTAVTNNGHIEYYIDGMVQKIQTLSDLQAKNQEALESTLPKISTQSKASDNLTSEQYLDYLLTPIEYSLTDLQDMLEDRRNDQLIGMVTHILIESAMSKFFSSYSKAYKQLGTGELADTYLGKLFSSDGSRQPDIPKKGNTLQKVLKSVKLVPKVIGQMKQNTKKYFSKKISGIGKWRRISSWEGFKGKLKNSLKVPITKMNKIKKFVTSSRARKRYLTSWIKNSKINKSTAIKTGFGLVLEGVATAIEALNWKRTADTMKESRENYEEHLAELRKHLQDIETEKDRIGKEWHAVITSFKDLSQVLRGFVQNASENADFADVIGLPRLPISLQHSIFNNDFDDLNESSLHVAQDAVISLLTENDGNLTVIIDQMRARNILYTSVRNKVNNDETVREIFSDLKDIFNFNPSSTVRKFGMKLTKKDSLCAIAVILVGEETYDRFNLQPFRPSCNVTNSTFVSIELEADNKRKTEILDSIVKRLVQEDNTVNAMNMLLYAKSVYMIMKDQTLQEYGRLLTEQDIVCTVATQFPEIEIFNFIDLSVFRPDCNAVSNSMFGSLKIKGKHLKSLMTEVDIKAKASPLRSLNPEDISPLSASSQTRFYLALFICPIIGLLITQ